MKKMRMLACLCVGMIVTVLIWHFICGCQSPAGSEDESMVPPTPIPAPESREVLIEEGIIESTPDRVVPERLIAPAPIVVREVVSEEAAVPPPPQVTRVPEPKVAEPVSYRIRKGDTLWSISRKFGVSVKAIQEANGISDAGKISIGQKLVIPGSEGES